MIEIIAYWGWLTLFVASIIAPWYLLIGFGIRKYGESLSMRIKGDWSDARRDGITAMGIFMKPWNMILDFFNIRWDSDYDDAGHVVPLIIGGIINIIMVLGLTELKVEGSTQYYASEYGMSQAIIHLISMISGILASYLSWPFIAFMVAILLDRVFVNVGKRAIIIKSKLDKLDGSTL